MMGGKKSTGNVEKIKSDQIPKLGFKISIWNTIYEFIGKPKTSSN
jgi:hypothetical protein